MYLITGEARKFAQTLNDLLKRHTGELERDITSIRSVAELHTKIHELKDEIEKLTIEKDRKQEEFDRREREVEHKVGLERKRQEFEVEAGKRDAVLKVREENLAADRKRFEEQMKFHEERFTAEVGYLKDMIGQVMARLPDVTLELSRGTKRA